MKKSVKKQAVALSTTLAVLGGMPVGALAEETVKTEVDQLRISESDQVEQNSLYGSELELENKKEDVKKEVKQATAEVKTEVAKEEVKQKLLLRTKQ